MPTASIIPHLFRTEYSKIVAVLVKQFGLQHIEIAEDIAGDSFRQALESWPYQGVPENPVAWLYVVAKNKTRNELVRNELFRSKVSPAIATQSALSEEPGLDLSLENIRDSQLRMLFAVCDPVNAAAAQISLALRILCGFGVEEIANALLTNPETINKRLFRAKEKLRLKKIPFDLSVAEVSGTRLSAVLSTLYLLFNEGYYSESKDELVRRELCLEAMRLTILLLENETTRLPDSFALMALMCFHASRFDARTASPGEMILYEDQNENLWDRGLIERGSYYLKESGTGHRFSNYHLEAGIAYWHTQKTDAPEKWEQILQLYNHLLQLSDSPVAALNRTYALAKLHGAAAGILAAEKLSLEDNRYYHALLGELYAQIDVAKARSHLEAALRLAKTIPERQQLKNKLDALA